MSTEFVTDLVQGLLHGLDSSEGEHFDVLTQDAWIEACDYYGPDGTICLIVEQASLRLSPILRKEFTDLVIREPLPSLTRDLVEKILEFVDWQSIAETWIMDLKMRPSDEQ